VAVSIFSYKYFAMNKIASVALSLACLTLGNVYAQNNSAKNNSKQIASAAPAQNEVSAISVVRLGTIETTTTSREKILAYPRLLPQSLDCEVTGYDFVMTANGKTWGPVSVKGAVLNEDIKDKIKDQDPSDVKISITNIRVKCGSEEVTAKPISIEYNH
jgi:hypothetical protein